MQQLTGNRDEQVIGHAIWTVDPDAKTHVDLDAKTVEIDSWLMPEEFLVAFNEAGYDVKITRG